MAFAPFREASRRVPAACALACALAADGCAVGTSPCEPHATYAVSSPPPKPLPEFPSARPTPGMVWVPGYWHWDATHYVWVPGHWETPPPGRRWQPAEVDRRGDGYRYRAAGWSCEAHCGGPEGSNQAARLGPGGARAVASAPGPDVRARPGREPG
jgi:hypothetical protein